MPKHKDKAPQPMADKDFMAESDLRTLIEAEKIKKDKARLGPAMAKKKEMMAAMAAVGGKTGGGKTVGGKTGAAE